MSKRKYNKIERDGSIEKISIELEIKEVKREKVKTLKEHLL